VSAVVSVCPTRYTLLTPDKEKEEERSAPSEEEEEEEELSSRRVDPSVLLCSPLLALFGGDGTAAAAASLEQTLKRAATVATAATRSSRKKSTKPGLNGGEATSVDTSDYRVMSFEGKGSRFVWQRRHFSSEQRSGLFLPPASEEGDKSEENKRGAVGDGWVESEGDIEGQEAEWRSKAAWEVDEDASDSVLMLTAWLDLYNRPPPPQQQQQPPAPPSSSSSSSSLPPLSSSTAPPSVTAGLLSRSWRATAGPPVSNDP